MNDVRGWDAAQYITGLGSRLRLLSLGIAAEEDEEKRGELLALRQKMAVEAMERLALDFGISVRVDDEPSGMKGFRTRHIRFVPVTGLTEGWPAPPLGEEGGEEG